MDFLKRFQFSIWEARADRVVPPSGNTARLTLFTSAAMAYLAVFALALSLATGRLAQHWSSELALSSTVRISAPGEQLNIQAASALQVLEATPGVRSARILDKAEERALLEPWFGPDLPLENLPVPKLIEVIADSPGYDVAGLRLRLQAEAPGAVLDDHASWRKPLVSAATRLRLLGFTAILLIAATTAAMITLAANSALAANGQEIRVLRLVGARDTYIVRAFVRRFSLRAFVGAFVGMLFGMLTILALPGPSEQGGFLTGLRFQGAQWFWPLLVPPLAGLVAFIATRLAAFRKLRGIT
ncbi:MAG: FtsX-like permease family protein [Paracoccaceae bacterium]